MFCTCCPFHPYFIHVCRLCPSLAGLWACAGQVSKYSALKFSFHFLLKRLGENVQPV